MTMLLECWQFSGRVSFSVRFTFPEAQNRKGSGPHFSSQDEIEVWFEVRLFLPAVLSFSRRTESRVQGEQSAPTQLPFCFLPSLFLVTSHSSLFLVTSLSSLFLVTFQCHSICPRKIWKRTGGSHATPILLLLTLPISCHLPMLAPTGALVVVYI